MNKTKALAILYINSLLTHVLIISLHFLLILSLCINMHMMILFHEISILLYIQFLSFFFVFNHMKLKAQSTVILHILPVILLWTFQGCKRITYCQMVFMRRRTNQTERAVLCKSVHTNQSDLLVHPPYLLYHRGH